MTQARDDGYDAANGREVSRGFSTKLLATVSILSLSLTTFTTPAATTNRLAGPGREVLDADYDGAFPSKASRRGDWLNRDCSH